MSERSCPVSGMKGVGGCPGSSASSAGPRGCAFIAHQLTTQSHYNPNGVHTLLLTHITILTFQDISRSSICRCPDLPGKEDHRRNVDTRSSFPICHEWSGQRGWSQSL